jgi:ribonuclease HII
MFWWTGSVVLRAAGFSQTPVVGGDARSSSIAAASIGPTSHAIRLWESSRGFTLDTASNVTRVTRPRAHIHALGRLGPLPLHRRSFAPVWMAGGVQQLLGLWGDRGEGEGRLGGLKDAIQ